MRAYRIGLFAALIALLAACGASEKMAPASVDQPAPGPDFANVTIIDGGPLVGMHFTHFGVNPTVDTAEQAESTFGLRADQASFGLAQLQLALGALPDRASVRVEDFVNALPAPASASASASASKDLFAVDAEVFPSPNRPGYDVLRVSLTARAAPVSRRVLVVIDADAAHRDAVRGIVSRLLETLTASDTIAVIRADGRVTLPLVRVTDARVHAAIAGLAVGHGRGRAGISAAARMAQGRGQLVYISDGLAQRDRPDLDALLDAARRTTALAWTIIGLGRGPYDDPRLNMLATASGGRYLYADPAVSIPLTVLAPRPMAARNARAQVQFDATAVTRYRLLGHERHAQNSAARRETGASIRSESTITALWEIKRAPGSKALGHIMIQASGADGRAIRRTVALSGVARPSFIAASTYSRQALVAAALAEKLRSAYWVRGVGYAKLRAQLDAIPLSARDAILDRVLDQAQALDTRPDAYVDRGPIAQMRFDHVPIVRR